MTLFGILKSTNIWYYKNKYILLEFFLINIFFNLPMKLQKTNLTNSILLTSSETKKFKQFISEPLAGFHLDSIHNLNMAIR